MTRWKCLTCKHVISDKYIHTRRTDPPHQKFIEVGLSEEDVPSITKQQTAAFLDDEMTGMKTMKIKLETLEAIKEISYTIEAATFDSVIVTALDSYKREQSMKEEPEDELKAMLVNTHAQTEEET